jgi:hypothetical protein
MWRPIREKMKPTTLEKIDRENKRDILSTFFAVPWQIVLFLTGMAVIFKRWDEFFWLLLVLVALSIGLYFNWFRHLSEEVPVD